MFIFFVNIRKIFNVLISFKRFYIRVVIVWIVRELRVVEVLGGFSF